MTRDRDGVWGESSRAIKDWAGSTRQSKHQCFLLLSFFLQISRPRKKRKKKVSRDNTRRESRRYNLLPCVASDAVKDSGITVSPCQHFSVVSTRWWLMPFSGTFVADASRAETANIMSNAQTREGRGQERRGRKWAGRRQGKGGAWMAERSVMRV